MGGNDIIRRGLIVSVLFGTWGNSAWAQDAPIPTDLQWFRSSVDSTRTFRADDSSLARNGEWTARAVAHYAPNLVLYKTEDGQVTRSLSGVAQLDVLAGWSLGKVRPAVVLPVILGSTSETFGTRAGLGDAGLDVKAGILDRSQAPLGLALSTRVRFPTSTVGDGLAAGTVRAELLATADRDFGDLRLMANLGTDLQQASQVGATTIGSGFRAELGAGYLIDDATGVSAELGTRFPLVLPDGVANLPSEGLVSGWRVVGDVLVRAGVGVGLTSAIGVPPARIVISVERAGESEDPDNDGIVAPHDICPYEAETINAIRDHDGCPEDPRVTQGDASSDGGVPSGALPTWLDPDGDGIASHEDECPDTAEDLDQFQDGDGCPEPDNDGDGILDLVDACPHIAENVNGFEDEDGCAELPPEELEGISGIVRGITFQSNSARLRPQSTPVLEKVLTAMLEHPTLGLKVEGHTDSQGDPDYNLKLSDLRAAAIRSWLHKRGIDEARVQTQGFGQQQPVASNQTDEGRAENRRVELIYETLEKP